jgi:predicted nuclease with TOPRIM domain
MKKNTKIENQLLEMIQPKIQFIENKFSTGEALSEQDVNTLLIKSAFVQINHLDERIDSIAADIAQLRLDFCELEGKFMQLESRFDKLENRLENLENRLVNLENRLDKLENRLLALEVRFEAFEARFETMEARLQVSIEKAIRTNIRWTLGLITFSLTLIKIVELIILK